MILQLVANLLFALMVASAYICFAFAYKRVGSFEMDVSYIISITFSPFFIGGLTLSFLSTFVRLAMFNALGISKTVLASELSVIMMLVLSLVIFREALGAKDIIGGAMILLGILLVGWR